MPPCFCNRCNKIVQDGDRHLCFFYNDNEIADNIQQADETEVDVNRDETTRQHGENFEDNNRNVCIAAQRIGNPSQASTYSCDICGKGFSRRAYFEAHSRTHWRQRRFACPFCNRRFPDQSNLGNHVETHGRRRYRCSQCRQTFRSNEERNRHFLQQHQQRE